MDSTFSIHGQLTFNEIEKMRNFIKYVDFRTGIEL
jgi:hypothetical protein